MGVPKFFRWMSERYPTISQLIAENRIPEFDCLYLDMNGIIHNCTHSDSDSPAFRMTEDRMFIAIFNYIEHLFGKIKPKKLFFMAIDGVAPRAKMNQQRARRFRTALDAEKAREKAIREGVALPKEEAFDSNCITPGTQFMARLTEQLKYFVSKKISEDSEWQGIEVVLSGHEVPGEGEHKIMEYIRLAKAQPDYDPNIRHCLYGLDADLIMLGLLSHDPHFCLLREEVTFGRQSRQKSKELEHQNFFLMHLTMVREYLEYEFQELKEPGVLSFPFDMERVIDDFILLAFFVGNDFLPNLPNLHINEGALSLQFKVYKEILPKTGGYINEHGVVNMKRLKLLLDELAKFEQDIFELECSDANFLKGKQKGHLEAIERSKAKAKLVLTTEQSKMYQKIRKWLESRRMRKEKVKFDIPASYAAKDRKFVEDLAASLRLKCQSVENEAGERHLQLNRFNDMDDDEDESEEEEEGQAALLRVFKVYDKAIVVDVSADEAEAELQRRYDAKFLQWKDDYYRDKFGFGLKNEEKLKELAENYVEGLQWVLFYYYRGVASWPWYYRYHYAPKISDIHLGLGANVNFHLGKPFKPFEQLMGVLPDRSKKIVPETYHDLMTNPKSSIIDFYPRDFELDMNGKKMEWEAVVKIPFIQEDRLLAAMATKEHGLTDDERTRNSFGSTLKFSYDQNIDELYLSSMPDVFPDIVHNRCAINVFELPTLEGLEIIVGLCEGAKVGASALAGFPSLKTLEHTAQLGFHGVNVFQQESRNESMVVTLKNSYQGGNIEEAKEKLGQQIYIGYPFLQEAKVVAVSDSLMRWELGENNMAIPIHHTPYEMEAWRKNAERIENTYSKKMGIVLGPVEIMVHVNMLKGLKRMDDGSMVKEFVEVPGMEHYFAAQTVVDDVISKDERFLEQPPLEIEKEFPEGTRAFFLGEYNYGRPLEVISHNVDRVDVWISTMKGKEPDFGRRIASEADNISPYRRSYVVAKMLNLNPLVLSRITSSFSVMLDEQRLNLGLNLKFEAKKLKVLGYSRRSESGWEFSQKAIDLVREYMQTFPEFFAGIQRHPQGDIYSDTDFYDPSESRAKITEIQEWLKKKDTNGFEKVPLEAQQLDGDAVKRIEAEATQYLQSAGQANQTVPKRVRNVPRMALLKPADAEHRLSDQKFQLGDRIVYVQASGKVPIATRGTVVGMTRTTRVTLLDVVFDHTFMSGSTLGERCSPFRGMTVPVSSVLNLTDRQMIAISAAAAKNAPKPEPVTAPSYGGMHPAPTPPPLAGSFSSAVRQPQNRGRGRGENMRGGGVPRGPANMFVRGPPPPTAIMQRGRGNGNHQGGQGRAQQQVVQPIQLAQPVQPGQYTAVPPPVNLTYRGGRGGRGRGNGRGVIRGGGAGKGQNSTNPVMVSQSE
ncbi:exonuclease II Exo2 [Rhizina undulata]